MVVIISAFIQKYSSEALSEVAYAFICLSKSHLLLLHKLDGGNLHYHAKVEPPLQY